MTTLDAAFDRLHDSDDWDAGLVEQLQQLKVQHGGPAVEIDSNVTVDCCTVYAGSLHVRGDFVFSSHVLVLGDLHVDGVVIGEPEHAILMVAGNVSARAMAFLRSYLCITGSVECREFFLGTSDGFAKVGSYVTAPLLLQEHFELMSLDNDDEPRWPHCSVSCARTLWRAVRRRRRDFAAVRSPRSSADSQRYRHRRVAST